MRHAAVRRSAQVRRARSEPERRPRRLGTGRARGDPARGIAQRVGHLGLRLRGHRRRARDCLLRVARHLRVRHEGQAVWQKDLGDKTMRNQFGEGSSPALHGNTLVVVWDHQAGSFIVALDKRSGEERWRVVRDEIDSGQRRSSSSSAAGPGRHERHEAGEELRSRDRKGRLARRRADDERDPVAGCGEGTADRDGRVPRQQPEGGSRRRGEAATSPILQRCCGRSTATHPTCRRRCCTTASCIC